MKNVISHDSTDVGVVEAGRIELSRGAGSSGGPLAVGMEQSGGRTKVVILTNIPTPYRLEQFNRLAASSRHEYVVYFCAAIEPNRQWRHPQAYKFRHQILRAHAHTFLGGYSYFVPGFFMRLVRERPRAVIVGGFSLQLLIARLYGWVNGSVVLVLSDTHALYEASLPAWRTTLRRCLVRGIDGAVACSRLGVDYLRLLGVPSERIALSRCVNDALSFAERARSLRKQRVEERRRFGLPEGAVIALFVGRLERQKGIIELLEAFQTARNAGEPELHLLLAGDGPLKTSLQETIVERSLTGYVHFAGFTPYEEMPGLYGLADLVVIPSLKECYSLVVNETIAAGLPMLCSVFAGARDLLEDGRHGCLFDPRDIDGFASLLVDAARRAREGTWTAPEELPRDILPETANAAIEALLERAMASWV